MYYLLLWFWVQLRGVYLPGAARVDARNLTRQNTRVNPSTKSQSKRNLCRRWLNAPGPLSKETTKEPQAALIRERRIRISCNHT